MTGILVDGEIVLEGRLVDSSNAALLVVCQSDGQTQRAVYKPRSGERPLWDFPSGTLGLREVATGVIDRELGWGLVPPTIWRDDAPLGPGSIQAWVDADLDRVPVDVVSAEEVQRGWITVAEGEGARGDHVCLVHEDVEDLRRLAVLDVIVNNADRKGGHVLRAVDGSMAGIDHGLTFHVEDKLRTVLWGWAGTPIDAPIVADLERAAGRWGGVAEELGELLTRSEIAAARIRLEMMLEAGAFPEPAGTWPALPWPAM